MADTTKQNPVHEKEKVQFPREAFMRMLTQRFFVSPSFEIYGGIAGLYDLGPPGCAIKAHLLQQWRQHFVLTENMLEVDCTCVTPEPVLVASGHVAKFADLMVKDMQNGSCYRADHLLQQHLEKLLETKNLDPKLASEYRNVIAQADTYTADEMHDIFQKYAVKAPTTNNDLSKPEPFNLMFKTSIGPTGANPGYLRPETAQGIFVNFKRLLEFNGGKLPFAAAQIGQAYRNEIAPRSGLLRVREFTLAEIEHFVNPEDKRHPKFHQVADLVVTLFPRENQVTSNQTTQMSIGEAVKQGIINNETLGYFIARTHLFLLSVGIRRDRLRFRQHLKDEMAHYACDCWDGEIQNSYGWTECVGIADRSCFDLTAHSKATKQPLTAFVDFPDGPRLVDTVTLTVDKGKIGKVYKNKAQILSQYLSALDSNELLQLEQELNEKSSANIKIGADEFEVEKDFLSFQKVQKKLQGAHITPAVIEPSFGMGRILYSLLEHAYNVRPDDEQRNYLSLPPAIAPVKVSVLPLLSNDQKMKSYIPRLVSLLTEANISLKVDDTGAAVGKRYARTDEIGIPFGITIDHTTFSDDTITLRERDSLAQVRIKIVEVPSVIQKLVRGEMSWAEVQAVYPAQKTNEQ